MYIYIYIYIIIWGAPLSFALELSLKSRELTLRCFMSMLCCLFNSPRFKDLLTINDCPIPFSSVFLYFKLISEM